MTRVETRVKCIPANEEVIYNYVYNTCLCVGHLKIKTSAEDGSQFKRALRIM